MVLLTLARAVLEKTGGDSMDEVRDSMRRLRDRLARPVPPPTVGSKSPVPTAPSFPEDVKTGDGVFGSGGDD